MVSLKTFIRFLDLFVPNEFHDDLDLLLRSRSLVVISLLVAGFWLPFTLQKGPLSVITYLGIAVFVLFMPLLLKWSSSLFWTSHCIAMVFTLSNFYRVFYSDGYEITVLWWCIIPPVIVVSLVGNISGVFWLVVNLAGIYAVNRLEAIGYQLPGQISFGNLDITINIIVLTIVFTGISLYLQISKNAAVKARNEEVKKTRELAINLQNIANEIKRNTSFVFNSTDELTKTSIGMKKSAEEITQIETFASTAISQSTATIHELAASLQDTVKRMKELEKLAISTEEKGKQGADIVMQSGKAMGKIDESQKEYDTILQAITEIADSAHLLSLNAAIEAAKAGEFGKGFFVVVEEIRNLAKRSNDAMIDIRKEMRKSNFIVRRGKNVILSTEEVFKNITQLVDTITDQVREITTAIVEQDIGIQEIAKETDQIVKSSEDNVTLVQELSQSIEDNTKTIEDLHQIAEQLEKRVVVTKSQFN